MPSSAASRSACQSRIRIHFSPHFRRRQQRRLTAVLASVTCRYVAERLRAFDRRFAAASAVSTVMFCRQHSPRRASRRGRHVAEYNPRRTTPALHLIATKRRQRQSSAPSASLHRSPMRRRGEHQDSVRSHPPQGDFARASSARHKEFNRRNYARTFGGKQPHFAPARSAPARLTR